MGMKWLIMWHDMWDVWPTYELKLSLGNCKVKLINFLKFSGKFNPKKSLGAKFIIGENFQGKFDI